MSSSTSGRLLRFPTPICGSWRACGCFRGSSSLLLAAWPIPVRVFSFVVIAVSAFCCLYAVANVVIFGVFGGFLTYPLLALVGDVRMVRSSVGAHLTMPVMSGLVGVPLAYGILLSVSNRWSQSRIRPRMLNIAAIRAPRRLDLDRIRDVGTDMADPSRPSCCGKFRMGVPGVVLAGVGPIGHGADAGAVFELRTSADFEPIGAKQMLPVAIRRAGAAINARVRAARRPPNVILIVLESVAARWTRRERRTVRDDANAPCRVRPRGCFRERLCAHRPQLEFAGGDSAVDVSQARFPRDHRAVSRPARDVAGVGFQGTRLSHGVHDAKRHELGGLGQVPGPPRLRTSARLSTISQLPRDVDVVGR